MYNPRWSEILNIKKLLLGLISSFNFFSHCRLRPTRNWRLKTGLDLHCHCCQERYCCTEVNIFQENFLGNLSGWSRLSIMNKNGCDGMHLASWICDEPSIIIRTNKSKQSREINLNNCSKKLKRTFKPAAHGFKQCHRLLLVDVQINSCHRAKTKMISLQLGSIFTFSKGNIEFERKVDVKNMSWRWTRRQDHDGQIFTSMVTIVNFSFDVDLKESVEDLQAPTFNNGRKLSTSVFLIMEILKSLKLQRRARNLLSDMTCLFEIKVRDQPMQQSQISILICEIYLYISNVRVAGERYSSKAGHLEADLMIWRQINSLPLCLLTLMMQRKFY